MAVYNAEKFLDRAVTSMLGQTFQDFEFIIINDGSTDSSYNILCSFNDERIKIIENENNQGLVYSLNKAIDFSSGKYIARMDADDFSYSTRLAEQFRFMEENPTCVASGSFARRVVSEQKDFVWMFPTSHDEMVEQLFWSTTIIHPTAIIKRKALIEIKYNPQFKHCEDYKLWYELSKVGKLGNIPKILIDYFEHPDQITSTKKKIMQQNALEVNLSMMRELNVVVPENFRNEYLKFINYDFTNWNYVDITKLSRLLDEANTNNEITNLFPTNRFSRNLAQRFRFVVFKTAHELPKAYKIYSNSALGRRHPFSLKEKFKLFYFGIKGVYFNASF